jgi:hypothetical protein
MVVGVDRRVRGKTRERARTGDEGAEKRKVVADSEVGGTAWPEFAKALEESPPGQWRVHKTGDTWRVMRLDSMSPTRPAVYETLRGVVLQDWTDWNMAEQRTNAVRALAKKYSIKYEAAAK